MSNKSIASKIQGLEQRLSAENEHRRREDLLPNSNNSSELHRGQPRRPRLMNITRPGALNLPFSLPAPCHQDSETENRLRDLKMRMNNLTINNHVYTSEIKDLDHLGELGNGTCGHVVKMLHKPSQTVIAVKQMRRSGNSEENKRILMDLDIVLRSQCPFIVKCFGCFVTEADVWICMELMASCFDKILKRLEGPVPEEILRKVTVSTVKALSYLKEEHGVIHRDVKPSNILVDSRGSIKLCDFGISGRLVDSKAKTRSAGCAAYMAPERIDPPNPQDPDYDIRADVWSLGISLVELATGIFPYRDCQNDFEVLTKVIHDDPPALPDNQSFSPEFRSFVKQCLTKDFSHRPKYNALLQHPFIVQSEASGVRVDQWLQGILPRCETSPTTCASSQNKMDYTDSSPILSFNKSMPLYNGNQKPHQSIPAEKAEQEDLSIPSQLEYSTLLEFQKWSIESPDQSFSESSKASCISVDHNSSLNNSVSNSSKISVEEVLTPTDRNGYSDKNNSLENLVISPTYKQVDLDNSSSFPSQVDKNMYKAHRSVVQSEVSSNPSLPIASNSKTNYSPATGTSPKEYHIQQRGRSLSNTMVCTNERLPPRNAAGPFNVKGYLVNSEMRHQPFPGGGPPSLESYVHQDDMHYHAGYPPCTYASPELTPRHYFSSNRNRPPPAHSNYDFERSRQQSFNDSQQNLVSSPNCGHGGLENVHDSRVTSPPCFRNNAPTTYFASSYTMAKFNAVPNIGQSYHHNPGGSCSQPASLEAYGDSRHHQQYAVNSRPPEKVYPPVLWSPQLVGKRSAREREERWKNEAQHPQVAGNTSPIVLQRFYHQQSQRRSRRDLRDGSPSQRSVSRDTSIGRSPEPPRRAHRDPSTGRTEPSLPMDEQSILERLEKEREKITPIERERDLHIPDCDSANRQSSKDKERQQPDITRSQQRYEKDGTHSQKLSNTIPHSLESPESSHTPKDRLEFRTRNESLNRSSRERKNEAINGECRNDESHNERDSLTSPKERFEQKLQERRNNKEIYVFPKERERKENNYNGEVMQPGKVTSRGDFLLHSPVASLKPGKSQKDKDEQASGGSDHQSLLSSPPPSAPHYSSPANTNFSKMHKFGGGIPRRIADCDQEIGSGVGSIDKKQEYGHFANGYKFKNSAPQPPPRKGSSESWSLPASPLPARPL